MTEIKLSLVNARTDQISDICDLVNLAYRGDHGWTRETDIVEGNRATYSEIEAAIKSENSQILVAYKGSALVSSVCIEKIGDSAFIGLFAVHPSMQGKGVGKHILALAEKYALDILNVCKYVMIVVSQREELISYYERRGYMRTGKVEEYPIYRNVGVPKVNSLTMDYMEKHVAENIRRCD